MPQPSLAPLDLCIADLPPEWQPIPEEIMQRLAPNNGIFTPAQIRELDRISAARYFRVKNVYGARCGSCRVGRIPGAKHPYLTMSCIEIPFNGLTEIVLFIEEHKHRDLIWSAMKPGTIDPIPEAYARKLAEDIRDKTRRNVLTAIGRR